VARHDLALASPTGHWPEAAAHWTSAFLLDPRNESVRWHLALGYEVPATRRPTLASLPWLRPASRGAPGLAGRVAMAPGRGRRAVCRRLLLLLLRAYLPPARWMRATALAAAGAGLVLR